MKEPFTFIRDRRKRTDDFPLPSERQCIPMYHALMVDHYFKHVMNPSEEWGEIMEVPDLSSNFDANALKSQPFRELCKKCYEISPTHYRALILLAMFGELDKFVDAANQPGDSRFDDLFFDTTGKMELYIELQKI